jgi:hypothetical protein
MSAFGGKADIIAISLWRVAQRAGRINRLLPERLSPHRTRIQICARSSTVQFEPRGQATSVRRTKGSAGGRRRTPLRSWQSQCGALHAPVTRRERTRSTVKLAIRMRVPNVCFPGWSGHRAVAAECLLLTQSIRCMSSHKFCQCVWTGEA